MKKYPIFLKTSCGYDLFDVIEKEYDQNKRENHLDRYKAHLFCELDKRSRTITNYLKTAELEEDQKEWDIYNTLYDEHLIYSYFYNRSY